MNRYQIGDKRLELTEGDITLEDTEAIANAANSGLLGGGGVDGAIHRAAGAELLAACRALKRTLPGGQLATGRATMTAGFRLRARHVIHCAGPIYSREGARAPALLAGCYREALRLCEESGLSSVAFPSIGTGVYGYPVDEAASVALEEIARHLRAHRLPSLVRMVLFDSGTLAAYARAAEALLGAPLSAEAEPPSPGPG